MVGPRAHRPGTLRTLLTILKGPFFVVCHPCRRPISTTAKDGQYHGYNLYAIRLLLLRKAMG